MKQQHYTRLPHAAVACLRHLVRPGGLVALIAVLLTALSAPEAAAQGYVLIKDSVSAGVSATQYSTYYYDAQDRLIRVEQVDSGETTVSSWHKLNYDGFGRLSTVGYYSSPMAVSPDRRITLTYDQNGRVARYIEDDLVAQTTYAWDMNYNLAGERESILYNSTLSTDNSRFQEFVNINWSNGNIASVDIVFPTFGTATDTFEAVSIMDNANNVSRWKVITGVQDFLLLDNENNVEELELVNNELIGPAGTALIANTYSYDANLEVASVTNVPSFLMPDTWTQQFIYGISEAINPCEELFFSEYIEGSSNNKAVEIYNPSMNAVDLSDYSVVLYVNGNMTASADTLHLSGMLPSGDVYVFATNQADATIQAEADTLLAYPSVSHFNGDDVLELIDMSNNMVVDRFGVIGQQPGAGWPIGTGFTEENTLVRMNTVEAGTLDSAVWVNSWEIYPQNTYTYIGSHTSTCVEAAPAPCSELFFAEYIEGSSNNKAVEVYNPTASTVTLDNYMVLLYSNGNAIANDTLVLAGSLASGEVYVFAADQADAAVLAEADTMLSWPSVVHYNGNDALELVNTQTNMVVDRFGVIGQDPSAGWPVGTGFTKDNTLVRVSTVETGTLDSAAWTNSWDVYPQDTYTYLGSHTSSCLSVLFPEFTFVTPVASVSEAIDTVWVEVALNNAPNLPTTVEIALLASSTATSGADFNFTPVQLNFQSGATASQQVAVAIMQDQLTEGDETIELALTNQSTGTMLVDSIMVITIEDDDLALSLIDDITAVDANCEPVMLEDRVRVTGVVSSIDFDGNSGYSFSLQDQTGGIIVYSSSDVGGYTDPVMGDSIEIIGEVDMYNGLAELVPEEITYLNDFRNIPGPRVVATLDEATEGELVTLENVWALDTTFSSSSAVNIEITNGMDTFEMRIVDESEWWNGTLPSGLFSVTGIGQQFDSDGSDGYCDNYQIFPRILTDIVANPQQDVDVWFLSTSSVVFENDTTVTVWVAYDNPNPTSEVINVYLDAAVSTATEGEDFDFTPMQLTLAPNTMDTLPVLVEINSDLAVDEGNEDVVLLLSGTGVVFGDSVHILTITEGVAIGSELENSVELFPNPAASWLVVRTQELYVQRVAITSATGQQVLNTEAAAGNEVKVDVSNLKPGVYFIRILTDKGSVVRPFVKK